MLPAVFHDRRGGINVRGPLQFRALPLRWLGDLAFTQAKPDRRRQGAPDAGVRERLTDPPLKRRSARERGARSNRAPGAAAVRWCTAVAHNDRAPGSSPGAATIPRQAGQSVIWRGAVDAVSAVRVGRHMDRFRRNLDAGQAVRPGNRGGAARSIEVLRPCVDHLFATLGSDRLIYSDPTSRFRPLTRTYRGWMDWLSS